MKKDVLQTRPDYQEPMRNEPEVREYRFSNLQTPNGILKFNFGETHKIETYILIPGNTYKLRRDVYDHVCSRGQNNDDWRPDGTGRMRASTVNVQPYYMLTPTSY